MLDLPSDPHAMWCGRCLLDVPSFLAFVGQAACCPQCDGPLVALSPAGDTGPLGLESPAPPESVVPPRRVVPWPTLPTDMRPTTPDWG